MRHVKLAVVVAVVALAIGAVSALQAQQLTGEYKIGVLEPLTGNLAAEGKRHLEGFEIMRDLINERFGGVMGKKLVFLGLAPMAVQTIGGLIRRVRDEQGI